MQASPMPTPHNCSHWLTRATRLGCACCCETVERVSVRDSAAATLLMHAALNSELDCMNAVIRAGTEINAQNERGGNGALWAARMR